MAGWRIEASGGCIRLAEGEAAAEICRLPGGYRVRYASVSAEAYHPAICTGRWRTRAGGSWPARSS